MSSDSHRLTVDHQDDSVPGKLAGVISTTRFAMRDGVRSGYLFFISTRLGHVLQAAWVGGRRLIKTAFSTIGRMLYITAALEKTGVTAWFQGELATLHADLHGDADRSENEEPRRRAGILGAVLNLMIFLRWLVMMVVHGIIHVLSLIKRLVLRLVLVWFEPEHAVPAVAGIEPMGETRRHVRGSTRTDSRPGVPREKTRSLDKRTDGDGPTNRVEIRCWSCHVVSIISGVRLGGCYMCPSCSKLMEVFDLPSGRSRPFVNRNSSYERSTEVDELPPLPQP